MVIVQKEIKKQKCFVLYHCSCTVSAVWIYLTTYIYNFTFSMYYVYNGFYVFEYIAHCWATFSALRALLSSHIMTNKDDDNDDEASGSADTDIMYSIQM